MYSPRLSSGLLVALGAGLCVPVLLAAKNFVKPVAMHAKAYPAHDNHPDERVTIAVDPYDTAEKGKVFSVDFQEAGILPVFFFLHQRRRQAQHDCKHGIQAENR